MFISSKTLRTRDKCLDPYNPRKFPIWKKLEGRSIHLTIVDLQKRQENEGKFQICFSDCSLARHFTWLPECDLSSFLKDSIDSFSVGIGKDNCRRRPLGAIYPEFNRSWRGNPFGIIYLRFAWPISFRFQFRHCSMATFIGVGQNVCRNNDPIGMQDYRISPLVICLRDIYAFSASWYSCWLKRKSDSDLVFVGIDIV